MTVDSEAIFAVMERRQHDPRGLSDAEVYRLIVPPRTLAHRVAKRQPLSKEESDKAVRVARIAAMAEQAFRDPDKAWRWLRKPKPVFDGKTPMEMLVRYRGRRPFGGRHDPPMRALPGGVILWRISDL